MSTGDPASGQGWRGAEGCPLGRAARPGIPGTRAQAARPAPAATRSLPSPSPPPPNSSRPPKVFTVRFGGVCVCVVCVFPSPLTLSSNQKKIKCKSSFAADGPWV